MMPMLPRLLTRKIGVLTLDESWRTYWLIAIAFAVVIGLEYLTPPQYVFGYLYTGTILLANSRLNRTAVLGVTLVAAGLTHRETPHPQCTYRVGMNSGALKVGSNRVFQR